MRRPFLLLLALSLALVAQPAAPQAQGACIGFSEQVLPFGFESITVSTTAVGFTTATIAPAGAGRASVAVVTTESNPLRWRADGTNPSSTVGHVAVADTTITICGITAVANFKMIRSGASDATVRATFFRGE